MLGTADELKQEIAEIDTQILDAEEKLKVKRASVSALEAFVDQKFARRMQLEGWLAREEATVRKPVGKCVIETMPNGDEWRV